MSREIKFKFWLGHTKKMTYEHSLIEISHAHWDFTEDIIPLQFTGLKDKNGKEIHEGDKVRFIAIEDTRKSHKTESTGVIEWDDEDAGFYILNDSDKFPHVKFWYAEELEVIGNIYEKPELLNQI